MVFGKKFFITLLVVYFFIMPHLFSQKPQDSDLVKRESPELEEESGEVERAAVVIDGRLLFQVRSVTVLPAAQRALHIVK